MAIRLGAAYIGLIFTRESPRCLSLPEAAELLGGVWDEATDPKSVRPIGVFVQEPAHEIRNTIESLGLVAVQVHGEYSASDFASFGVPVIRAVRMKGPESHGEVVRALSDGPVVLDSFVEGKSGGTGKLFDHELAIPHIRRGQVFVAGGLNPENIADAAQRLSEAGALPYAFDVSSGLEVSPGIKSPIKMTRFFAALRGALSEPGGGF
ncbi:MAG: phosphoribosylanthranilate isomerase [Candidatus Sumerlaeota bacterium]|nr:phosphoribosylanthranilate isomerase [Candidatus Sumerlaeota bacterium]